MQRTGSALMILPLCAVFSLGAPAPGARKLDLAFHKGVPASGLEIKLSPAATVTRTKQGLVLPLKITNLSAHQIQTTLAHEWHGGEWPLTALYASATPEKDRKTEPLTPVYLVGEDQNAARAITVAPGQSVNVEVRMDWPGTGSVHGVPLIRAPGKYTVRFVMVFEAAGKQHYTVSPPKDVELPAR